MEFIPLRSPLGSLRINHMSGNITSTHNYESTDAPLMASQRGASVAMSQLNTHLTMNHLGACLAFPDTLVFRKTYRVHGTPLLMYYKDESPKCTRKSRSTTQTA